MNWSLLFIIDAFLAMFAVFLWVFLKSNKSMAKHNVTPNVLLGSILSGIFLSLFLPALVDDTTRMKAVVFMCLYIFAGLLFLYLYATAKDKSEDAYTGEVTKSMVLDAYGLNGRGLVSIWYGGLMAGAMLLVALVISMFTGVLGAKASLMSLSAIPQISLVGMDVTSGLSLNAVMILLNSSAEDFFRASLIVPYDLAIEKWTRSRTDFVENARVARKNKFNSKKYKYDEDMPKTFYGFYKQDYVVSLFFGVLSVAIGMWFSGWHTGVLSSEQGIKLAAKITILIVNGIIMFLGQLKAGLPAVVMSHFLYNMLVSASQ